MDSLKEQCKMTELLVNCELDKMLINFNLNKCFSVNDRNEEKMNYLRTSKYLNTSTIKYV